MNTHDIFDFLSKKVWGGHFICGPHQAEKWGGGTRPPVPHRSTPVSTDYVDNLPFCLLRDRCYRANISIMIYKPMCETSLHSTTIIHYNISLIVRGNLVSIPRPISRKQVSRQLMMDMKCVSGDEASKEHGRVKHIITLKR